MRVNPNSDVPIPANVSPAKSKPQVTSTHEQADLDSSGKLEKALKNVPAVRAEKIAQAKALLGNAAYPTETTLQNVAGILANYLKPGSPAE